MLEIKNTLGQVLELAPDQRLTIELISTLFSEEDVLPGSKSLPVSMPLTENNQAFLEGKFTYFTDSLSDVPVSVNLHGLTLHRCILSYRIRNNKIEAALKIDMGQLVSVLRKLKLKDVISDQIYIGTEVDSRNNTLKLLAMAEPGTYPITFFPVKNENFFEKDYAPEHAGWIYANHPYVNWWDRTTQKFVTDGTLGLTVPGFGSPSVKVFGLPIVPFVYMRYTIEAVCKYLNLKAVGSWLDEYETRRAVWDNNVAVFEDYLSTGIVLITSVLDVNNYVPDLNLIDFFKYVRGYFGVGIFVDTTLREVHFKTAKTLVEEEIYEHVGFADPKKITIEQESSLGITLETADISDDIYKDMAPRASFVIGEGEKTMSLKIGTLPMLWEYNPIYISYRWVLPATKIAGNTPGNLHQTSSRYYNIFQGAQPPNACPPRLLIYHGLQPDSSGELYPYASSISINYAGTRLSSYSLWPDEPDCIFNKLQKWYYELIDNARTITSEHLMSITQVARLKPDRKIAGRLDGLTLARFLLKQISYALSDRAGAEVLVQLKLVPLKPASVAPSVINNPTEGNVYVELLFLGDDHQPVLDESQVCDIWAVFWTTPDRSTSQSVTELAIILQQEGYDSQFGATTPTQQTIFCNGIETKLIDNIVRYNVYTDSGTDYFNTTSYFLVPTTYYRIL